MLKSGTLAMAPAMIPMQWPIACWRGLAPSMYPGLMSIRRLDALPAASAVMPAVMRFAARVGSASSARPNVNCVILANDPVGVIEVSAVALAAISESTNTIGIASAPQIHSRRTTHAPSTP